ncbi:hypothetical protein VF14_14935 [Nostoc linckia z18]|uniref:Uncharacterized protein n=2 Tax=Nostoc linckia TaxID=92942 RepID=A0A9Q5ZDN9_NOSLI|nr:hypothetical protein VF07_23120 [Nostoc linckia z6]PHJ87131.1 hypothetical protein VF06_02195 [Nostoc linckia z4]PHJ97467.1 hypothetical protein VF04_12160 [Nostoc linckia z7]PHK04633.1 hypothetical protein VF08_10400 [Nostoc linckia z8]PHK08735.1 hypothetical protein VF09_18555 [Nostoc linckia z9]PHK20154.1 hypothetical protein VF11_12970 [Nostoc linckia z14]PHK24401.1 hypothetical protein VF10_11980 [Nostoc linckia z13]PHK33973.1 hypothetical protein VF14_14935 [Nostoc linckia z18]PHK3
MGEAVRSWGLPKWSNCRHWVWGDEEVGSKGENFPLSPQYLSGFGEKGQAKGERKNLYPLPFSQNTIPS